MFAHVSVLLTVFIHGPLVIPIHALFRHEQERARDAWSSTHNLKWFRFANLARVLTTCFNVKKVLALRI